MISAAEAREMLADDASAASLLFNAEPNSVGEVLRAITFPAHRKGDEYHEVGCYTTFDHREDATPIEGPELVELCEIYIGGAPEAGDAEADLEFEDEMSYALNGATAIHFVEGGVSVDCFWHWDGDGYLLYRVRYQGSERAIANSDCKKNYGWIELERAIAEPDGESTVTDPELERAIRDGDAGEAVIRVYRRMEAAAAGARAERDIMRAAIEEIAAGVEDPVEVAKAALASDRERREKNAANVASLLGA